jgi:hypothetical protein
MAESDGRTWGDTLRPQALGNVLSTTPSAEVKQWKISYCVATELDLAMPEAFQTHLVEAAREAGAEVAMDKIKSGHFLQITHAQEVAESITRIVLEFGS